MTNPLLMSSNNGTLTMSIAKVQGKKYNDNSKGNRNDARDKRKEVGKLGEEKVGMRSKVPTKSQYANHLVEEQQYR